MTIRTLPTKPRSEDTSSAFLILSHTHNTCKSFLDVFETIRRTRNARGAPRDDEQDLLRAMLLFASAGLDSLIKQLVRDTLSKIIDNDIGARKEFEKFVEKLFKGKTIDNAIETFNVKDFASIIVEESPKNALIQKLIFSITSNSLQSVDQLLRVAANFGITAKEVHNGLDKVRKVFGVRNKISHEMDIDFSQSNRNRYPRRKGDMINYTNILLTASDNFIKAVDKKLLSF